jgi:hypothetical protein
MSGRLMSCGNNSGEKYGGEILWLASATGVGSVTSTSSRVTFSRGCSGYDRAVLKNTLSFFWVKGTATNFED